MNRISILLLLNIILLFTAESKPLKKKITIKTVVQTISVPEIKKDTVVVLTDTQKEEIRLKIEKANGLIYNNTTYYYSNKKPSVKVGDWQAATGKRIRKIFFFDKNGKQTFELTDEKASYSIVTYIHFREDGSVDRAEVHENPGASMYTYLITIWFTENNIPLSKYRTTNPNDFKRNMTGTGMSVPVDTWDSTKHIWIVPEPPKIKGMHYENGMYINDNFSFPKY